MVYSDAKQRAFGKMAISFDASRIRELPALPGVYIMKDAQGRVLYVGKAVNLRNRVASYFRRSVEDRPSVRFLLQRLADLEVVVTETEKEALILEKSFIKKHRPRYNVAFRDDKNYLLLRIDVRHPFPRASLVRRPQRDGALYFGPYASSQSVRQTLRLLQRHMGIRTCGDNRLRRPPRSCLNEQVGRCAGVCLGKITREQYAERVRDAILFLQGRSHQLLGQLEARMKEASRDLRFEEAARIRDQIAAIRRTVEGQRVETPLGPDRDIIGLYRSGEQGMILVLRVREGKVSESLGFPLHPTRLEDREIVSSFVKQFYDEGIAIPPEVLVPEDPGEERMVLEQWLAELAGHRVKLLRPRKGAPRALLEMARQNARLSLEARTDIKVVLLRMAECLHLRRPPRVMEGFDISTMGGEDAMGSAVRFVDGVPERSAYRVYGIRGSPGTDDYAMMYELLQRHLKKRREQGSMPDLLVLDGGKGQLGVAIAVLEELGLKEIEAVALAKGRHLRRQGDRQPERVFIPGRKEGISLKRDPHVLGLLQHLRDEAHRFAVGHHRKRRARRRTASLLDAIRGVGPARKRALLKHFGSLKKVQEASVEALSGAPLISHGLARVIFDALNEGRSAREPTE